MNAVKYLTEATKQRHESWVRRMLYHSLQSNGQYEKALEGWQDYLRNNPGHQVAQRQIVILEGLMKEREAEEAGRKAKQIRKQAAQARADGQEARAAQLEREAEGLEKENDRLYSEAREIWTDLNATMAGGDKIAQARLMRMEALELYEEDRVLEALARLRYARFESSQYFEEFSDLIINMCLENELPLNLSERKLLLQREETRLARAAEPQELADRTFEYDPDDDVWTQQGYDNQDAILLMPRSEELTILRRDRPVIDQFIGLGDHVFFSVDDQWYEFRKELHEDLI
jgi:hypothetical protein